MGNCCSMEDDDIIISITQINDLNNNKEYFYNESNRPKEYYYNKSCKSNEKYLSNKNIY